MRKHRFSGKFTAGFVSLLLALCVAGSAMGCSLFYFGGDWTDDGANLFFRGEDQDGADENKLYLITPAGKHRAGEDVYRLFRIYLDVYT